MFKLSKLFGFNSEWESEKRAIVEFGEKLRDLGEPQSSKNIFEYLVSFFQICSDFQDVHGAIHHAPDYQTMVGFNRALARSGRDRYGWNRTVKGERVTMDNVYLGGVYGLFTHSARTWNSSNNPYEGFYRQWAHKDAKDPTMREVIGNHQVLPFVCKNRQEILDSIAKMKEA